MTWKVSKTPLVGVSELHDMLDDCPVAMPPGIELPSFNEPAGWVVARGQGDGPPVIQGGQGFPGGVFDHPGAWEPFAAADGHVYWRRAVHLHCWEPFAVADGDVYWRMRE